MGGNKGVKKEGSVSEGWLEYILIHYRWVIVILFLLPMSVIYDLFYAIRSYIVFTLTSAPKQHAAKVKDVQAQVSSWIRDGRRGGMCTARPGWQTISFRQPKYKTQLCQISINLVDILEIDVERKEVTVEPLVTMGQLTSTLEPLGWTIPVLPELDDLTVGGLVMGTGIETSSHKYGLFQHICRSFELVMADGSLLTCSKEEKSELFYAVPWSYGTLGFLTAVKIQIIPANRFVRMEYLPVHSLDETVETFKEKTLQSENNEFVECLMFSQDEGVVMVANQVTSAEPQKVNRIGGWYKPWFFKHVEGYLRRGKGIEYIPIRDYYHRHSRSIFWEIQEIIPFGNNPLFRYLLGWMVPPKVSLLKLTQPAAIKKLYEQNHMIQDMLVPIQNLKESLQQFHTHTAIYPLWVCPFKLENNGGMVHSKGEGDSMYVDIGAYGVPNVNNFNPQNTTRTLEAFVRKVNGFQMLYADTYMTKDEFRLMFDHKVYDKMRKEYNCIGAFPDVYDKVARHARD